MSQDEKDAVIGRVTRERTEVRKHVAILRAEARRFGQMFSTIGRDLENHPEYLGFNGMSANIKYARSAGTLYEVRDINGEQVFKLIADLRASLDVLEKLDQEAKTLGID